MQEEQLLRVTAQTRVCRREENNPKKKEQVTRACFPPSSLTAVEMFGNRDCCCIAPLFFFLRQDIKRTAKVRGRFLNGRAGRCTLARLSIGKNCVWELWWSVSLLETTAAATFAPWFALPAPTAVADSVFLCAAFPTRATWLPILRSAPSGKEGRLYRDQHPQHRPHNTRDNKHARYHMHATAPTVFPHFRHRRRKEREMSPTWAGLFLNPRERRERPGGHYSICRATNFSNALIGYRIKNF